jgi:hypothetical protein
MVAVAVIGQKKLLATTALAATVLSAHGRSNNGRKTTPCTPTKYPPKKTSGEEGRKVLSEDGKEDSRGRKRNLKPPAFLHIQTAARTNSRELILTTDGHGSTRMKNQTQRRGGRKESRRISCKAARTQQGF